MTQGENRKESGLPGTSQVGAVYRGDGECDFTLWAPAAERVELHLISPTERFISLEQTGKGYYGARVQGVRPGTLYRYRLNGRDEYPDPASRSQPQGVWGPSEVTDPDFQWEDGGWRGFLLQEYIIYELHTGTFTEEGTFESIIPHLDELVELGVTAVELMPVAQFPGNRNWGYDVAYPFAVQESYGGGKGLKKLVNACHQKGLAVILDVVYNHMGPEGNFMEKFGPYFTGRYKTEWGRGMNFDGQGSDEVRCFFIQNALYWITEYHIDSLRLDAVHAILDFSPRTFIEDLASAIKAQSETLNQRHFLIAESVANDARLIRPGYQGGYGLDAQWNDDFHHALHVLLTGEQTGFYQDFGHLNYMVKALREGFAYDGEYSSFHGRRRGTPSGDIPPYRLVVFSQNHDQVGNRMEGDRLSRLVSFEALKLAAGMVLLSPYIPLLFMGEEYGEQANFPYFVSHSDPEVAEAVWRGRKAEFEKFHISGRPPDPQSEETFRSARLNHDLKWEGRHRILREYYRELIRLRKGMPALSRLSKEGLTVMGLPKSRQIFMSREAEGDEILAVFNFGEETAAAVWPAAEGRWRKRLDSADRRWEGEGSLMPDEMESEGELRLTLRPKSVVLWEKEGGEDL